MHLKAFLRRITDTLFPSSCLSCRIVGSWLCEPCRKKIILKQERHCPFCQKRITPYGSTCPSCSERHSLDGIFSATHYRLPIVAHALHAYKYRFVQELSEPLGAILRDALHQSDLPLPDILIPVPLHPRRLRFRGFNQSLLLAEYLSRFVALGMDIPVRENALYRTRYTNPQMRTHSRKERLDNLRDAFAIERSARKNLSGKNIWLIDDVATTGATLEACAKLLKKAGARSVFGIVIAN